MANEPSLLHPLAGVPRHQGRVIKLLYCGEGPVQKTLMLVGKVRGLSIVSFLYLRSTTFYPVKSIELSLNSGHIC